MLTHFAFYLILNPPDWSIAQGYHGVEGEGYAIRNPNKHNGNPKSKRSQAFTVAGQSEVGVEKELPRRRAGSHGFLKEFALCPPLREALYKRKTLIIPEWSPRLWRQSEPKDLQIWSSESPLLAQVALVSRDSWQKRENKVVLTLGSSQFILLQWKTL